MSVGVASMSAPLRRVLVRRPALSGDWAGAGWRTTCLTCPLWREDR
jgi:hypothetical protein